MTTPVPFEFFTAFGPVAATIHRPVDDLTTVTPTVLVTGSWLTVKEQMPDLYAKRLAALGYTAITFDFPGFGASGGTPRQAEIPAQKAQVIAELAGQVRGLSFATAGLGHLAVCASAQYTLRAVADGAPIDAVTCVAGWFHDTATVAALYGGDDGVAQRLALAADAVAAFRADGTVRTVPAYDKDNQRAAMFLDLDYYASADRGAIPAWTNGMAELSWQQWLTFDGLSSARRVEVPTLFVHGDDCVLPDNVRALAGRLASAELIWTDGFQTDFYDLDPQVSLAVEAADRHFRKHLPAGGTR